MTYNLTCPSCAAEELELREVQARSGWTFTVATCGLCSFEFEVEHGDQVVWLGDVATIDASPTDVRRRIRDGLETAGDQALRALLERERRALEQSAPNLLDEWLDDDPMVEVLQRLQGPLGSPRMVAEELLPLLDQAVVLCASGRIDYTGLMGRGEGW